MKWIHIHPIQIISIALITNLYVSTSTSPLLLSPNIKQQKQQLIKKESIGIQIPLKTSILLNISMATLDLIDNKTNTPTSSSSPSSSSIATASTEGPTSAPSNTIVTSIPSSSNEPTVSSTLLPTSTAIPTSIPSISPSFRPRVPRTRPPTAVPSTTPTRAPTRPTAAPSLKLQSNHNGKNQATSSPSDAVITASANVTPMDMISATPGVLIMIIVMSIVAACLLAIRLYYCFRQQPEDSNVKNMESLAIPIEDGINSYNDNNEKNNSNQNANGQKSPRRLQSPRQVVEGQPRILKFTNNLNEDFSLKTPQGHIVPSDTMGNNNGNGECVDGLFDDVSSHVSYENLYSTYSFATSPQSKL